MRDVIDELERWWRAGETVGIGTVVGTWKSAPRQPGAAMLVGPDGTAVGSVSGGCVEGAVYELAEAARDGGAPVLQRYGVSDDDAFAVGLTCGGIIDVFVEQVEPRDLPRAGPDRRGHPSRAAGRRRDAHQRGRRRGSAAAWSSVPDSISGSLGSAPSRRRGPRRRRGLLAAGPHRRPSTTDRTASGAATTSRCSSRPTRRGRA